MIILKPLKVDSYVVIDDDKPLDKLATAVSNVMNLYPVSRILQDLFKSLNLTRWRFGSWWDSNLIPKFTKIFEYSKNFRFIVFVIKNDVFRRNLSPWARSRAEKWHWASQNFRLGQTPFKMIIFQNFLYHRDQGW